MLRVGFATLLLATWTAAAAGQSAETCGVYGQALSPGALAAIPPDCRSANCLIPLDASTAMVPEGSLFIYRPATPSTQNSLVVVQRKYLARSLSEVSTDVWLRRDHVPFACAKTDAGPIPPDRADANNAESYARFDYDTYETTMRDGYQERSKASEYLNNHFHVIYDNGAGYGCVSTRDPLRRQWLLLDSQDRIHNPLFALLARLLGSNQAIAAPAGYHEIRMNVYPYEKKAEGGRCLSFPVKGEAGHDVDLVVYDIEDLVAQLPFLPRGVDVQVEFTRPAK